MFSKDELELLVSILDVVESGETMLSAALARTEWGSVAATAFLSTKQNLRQSVADHRTELAKGRRMLTKLKTKVYKIQDHVLKEEVSSEVQGMIDNIMKGDGK